MPTNASIGYINYIQLGLLDMIWSYLQYDSKIELIANSTSSYFDWLIIIQWKILPC